MGGSFQNGYHITGMSSPSPFIQRFINSSWYDRYEEPPSQQLITMIWSLIVSMYTVGGLFGSVSVQTISNKLGRKKSMMCSSFVSVVAAVIMLTSKRARSYEMIIVARILFGFSTGLGSNIQLTYLGEISPKKIRGIVSQTAVMAMSLGKLSGQLFGLSEILGREELWNIDLIVPTVFSIVNIIAIPFFPDAPRFLFIEKGDDKACKKALQSLWGPGDYKQEMDEMLEEQVAIEAAPPKSALQLLRDRTVRWQLFTISFVFACSQLSGSSVISTFSFDIFLQAGVPVDKIRYVTLGLGVTEILTCICCGLLIERTGRKPLLCGGFAVMSSCMVLITVMLNLKDSSYWVPYVTSGLIILFIIFLAGGPAGVAASLLTETFIQSDRMASFVLMGFQRWFCLGVVGLVFPFLVNALDSYCFVLFACMGLLGFLYSFFIVPETKGKSLLEISKEYRAITVCGKSFSKENKLETKL
ncbi:solute carrier family 2 member 9, like 1 [Plectropomus leopardus]|uniref:solute carrier family 2 member 9, like 1 n=1 Tax=Plectropomus leopardus TaxID=160734 RepID=UPI001C4AD7BC|nr:solute carrier family 2 member 9, like 1 [Plectropomus leopardus]